MIGRKLAHYEIVELLGRGGMGEVYRARDSRLDRDVALKILSEDLASDAAFLERFDREAKIVAGLNHPHIVHVYAVEQHEDVRFLAMEFIEGEELAGRIDEDGLPIDDVLEIGISIADALVEAHGKGVVHRDLKPANVMVTREGRVKVLDFGLAKWRKDLPTADDATAVMELTQHGSVLGTVPYMSPEQVRGIDVDARSDIFSVGVILQELATGRRPFSGATPADVSSSILKDEPPLPSALCKDLPAAFDAIVVRCLAKDVGDRYGASRELVADLLSLRRKLESGVSTPPPVAKEPMRLSRRGAIVALAAVAALAMVGLWYSGRVDAPDVESARPILAVLPFDNLGGESEAAFAAGITDEITSRLTQIDGLGVVSRTSARAYAHSNQPISVVGQELGAGYVLEGAIRWDKSKQPGRVRINTRLIQVEDDTNLWSRDYERELTEIFALQASIAENIAGALDVKLLAPVRAALDRRPTASIEAYEFYLIGKAQLDAPSFDREIFEESQRMFDRAIALDPGFAAAYAGLASINARMVHYGYDRSAERVHRANEAADTAVRLGPDLAETHLARGNVHYWAERDYSAALEALETARGLDPNHSGVWLTTAYVKRRQGDLEGAIDFFRRDLSLSPRDPNVMIGLAETYGALRLYAEAEEVFRRAVGLTPNDPYSHNELALLELRRRGDSKAARAALSSRPSVDSRESHRVDFLVELLDRQFEAALRVLDGAPGESFAAGSFFLPFDLLRGMVHASQGRREVAREAFERARVDLAARLQADPLDHRLHASLGLALAGLGSTDEALGQGGRAVELHPLSRDAISAPVVLRQFAQIQVMVGRTSDAITTLREVFSVPGDFSVAWMEADPRWDPLRSSPGYAELVEEFGAN